MPGRAPPNVVPVGWSSPPLGLSETSATGSEQAGHSQEEVLHDVVVVGGAAVWEEAGREHDDGIETFAIVPWGDAASEWPQAEVGRALSELPAALCPRRHPGVHPESMPRPRASSTLAHPETGAQHPAAHEEPGVQRGPLTVGLQRPSCSQEGALGRGLTSVGHHPHVGPDHVQVDPVLLFSDDHRPPQAPVGSTAILSRAVPKQVRAVPRHVLGSSHGGVIWKRAMA